MSDKTIKRPLSPHLQVYRPQMTSMLSILHRATGIALAAGTLMVIWWLWAAATTVINVAPLTMPGVETPPPPATNFDIAMNFAASPLGLLLLFGWSFSLYYHMLNGIRHLVWDTGRLFNIEHATKAGYAVFYGAIVITILTWVYVYV